MTYTSGTTGRRKGVQRPLSGLDPYTAAELGSFLFGLFGIPPHGDGVHIVTAPLYHTAVSNFATAALNSGHAVVLMDGWTPEDMLERTSGTASRTRTWCRRCSTACCGCLRSGERGTTSRR
jgi:long-chain acyl-CoA synthetase